MRSANGALSSIGRRALGEVTRSPPLCAPPIDDVGTQPEVAESAVPDGTQPVSPPTSAMVPSLRLLAPNLIVAGVFPVVGYALLRPHVSSGRDLDLAGRSS
jgi:hypothetical protein